MLANKGKQLFLEKTLACLYVLYVQKNDMIR